ncbi:L-seryl-tRNA(Sec) selenium transferase [Bacillus aquiflavi]|uniref:L-seryl-tRNA(Sec) selenium transferase n=1 Tax=Bacillus aquiflavi TaxID=2672567 RepID=A0A6B3W4L8_9BACI|nr:L-seryl-tRNA(Sec) selenium transferase [Bacillus aquiflavi]MBA4538570.1 L-seryl-tRNA(Sec) selenium transferase [Bacillus aquiflavi]NEY82933.1 L-seryl-tRNA(Sec) selenium transferase [Bacillus aquiflavi]UAC49556.1 L-seryl-tRNA(Sec) selenium transferase [Bacillus aquiflavi]
MKQFLRYIPPVHELQKDERFKQQMKEAEIDVNFMTEAVKNVIDHVRQQIIAGSWSGAKPGTAQFISQLFSIVRETLQKQYSYTLKRVINGTGTILHTNLGRARLSSRAAEHVLEAAQHYSNLEYELEAGERGSRHSHVEQLITKITGAESAMVVNNNAAAVYLVLRALASEKEVIVSRGQLVEIGGSFRISSIMEESGAQLVEVGTTNKTHLYDYEQAINENTAMILKVHTSNFKTIGFTKSVDREELAALAKKHAGIIFYEDLGSGVLYDFEKHGIGEERAVGDVLKKGVDLVSFSGDKLLGGPQAGIIAGKKKWIDQLKKHQLARVVRVDKMTLAALEGTLMDYLKGDVTTIPTLRDLLIPIEQLKERTIQFIETLQQQPTHYKVRLKEGVSQVGGGTMPGVELPTYLAAIRHKQISAEHLGRSLRTNHSPPIIARIQNEEILFDLRTITKEEERIILNALLEIEKLII